MLRYTAHGLNTSNRRGPFRPCLRHTSPRCGNRRSTSLVLSAILAKSQRWRVFISHPSFNSATSRGRESSIPGMPRGIQITQSAVKRPHFAAFRFPSKTPRRAPSYSISIVGSPRLGFWRILLRRNPTSGGGFTRRKCRYAAAEPQRPPGKWRFSIY